MVTQGFAVSVTSSGVRSGSTSTGLVVAIRPWWHSRTGVPALRWAGARVDRSAHRPLRADDAAGRTRSGYGEPPSRLRAVPAPAPRRPPVRRGGRRRPGPGRDRGLPLRRRGARGPDRRRGRADAGVAVVVPLLRRRVGLPPGRDLLPVVAAGDRGRDVRRGGAARDRAAVDLQPRLRDRVGGLPDDDSGGRPA